MSSLRPLSLVTDGQNLRRNGTLVSRLKLILNRAGSRVSYIQIREQVHGQDMASDEDVTKLVAELLPVADDVGAKVVVNRNVPLAVQAKAHGVHLGARSMLLREARALLGEEALLGYSAHSMTEVHEASRQGASYVSLSPIFSPASKESERSPLGLDYLRKACESAEIPVYAQGGISAGTASLCRKAGASGISCIDAVLLKDDCEAAVAALLQAWDE